MRNQYFSTQAYLFWTCLVKGKISLKKLWNVFKCSLDYTFQKKNSATLPFVMSIELGNECNTACLFCRNEKGVIYDINPSGSGNKNGQGIPKGKMPLDMALNIIDQTKDHSLIAVLYTNGEPLLYHDLPKVIRYASERKLATMIASNGLALNERIAQEILEAGLDLIKIQLGGFTQDIYSVQIRYGNVEKLKENIRRLVDIRKKGNYKTVILIDWISYQYNAHQLPLIRQFCDELGVLMNMRPGNPRNGLEDKEKALYEGTLPLKMSCDWLWKGMQVNWNGDILPCCEAVVWGDAETYEKFEVGKTDLKKVFNGEAANKMRKDMAANNRCHSMCQKCLRTGMAFKW